MRRPRPGRPAGRSCSWGGILAGRRACCWVMIFGPGTGRRLAYFREAVVSEVFLEVATRAAGDYEDLGAVGVGSGAGEAVHFGPLILQRRVV